MLIFQEEHTVVFSRKEIEYPQPEKDVMAIIVKLLPLTSGVWLNEYKKLQNS